MGSIVNINNSISVGPGQPLILIAGPCQIESLDHCLKIASFLKGISERFKVNLVFKSSYDKANRTSLEGKRGPGIDEGLRVLDKVREETGVPVLTDVHSPAEAETAGGVVDIIQTPALLCRQTDLLIAAGKTGKAVNIKKGQFLAPQDMKYAAQKVASTGNNKILLCERGTCFGYRDLVVDMRSLELMRDIGYPLVFDGTHSVQVMGGREGSSGGNRRFILPLVKAACAVGIDALFIECHDNPAAAPSDGASMLPLEEVPAVVEQACRIRDSLKG